MICCCAWAIFLARRSSAVSRRPICMPSLERLLRARRLLEIKIAGEKRVIAVEDAARYRDALGIPLPPGIAASLLEPVAAPVLELAAPVRTYARPIHDG